ncbi:response regulator [Pontibacter vulgaris]|uniref:response regulator n=1 Tax=Pontibacter vulgaris TaxID=2905679 RepID=UPI001FA76FED|nr:response regulator [Pontibacter vulgaris]
MANKLKEVLIIDDDMTANYLNERIVTELQIADHVKILTNGKDGLDYILEKCADNKETCPELIILDHFMPLMDGLELMETLHKSGKLENMRAVFLLLAIHTNIKDLKRFKMLGVQEFTNKPLSREKLLESYQKYWADDTVKDHTLPEPNF